MHTIAVYGTLRRDGCRGHVLTKSRFLGMGKTDDHFHMHDLGSYPGAVPGGHTPMVVELYVVDDATLAILDQIEGTNRNRLESSFYVPHNTVVDGVPCSLYILNGNYSHYPVIESGDWIDHIKNSELV